MVSALCSSHFAMVPHQKQRMIIDYTFANYNCQHAAHSTRKFRKG
jgi:hypothetical protein